MAFLVVDRISKRFGTHRAVDAVSFELSEGECLALLGPSGCGKTTLLNTIAGFTKADSGEILVGGRPMTDVPAYRRDMGMVFQDYALFPHLDVIENVEFGLRMRRVAKTERREAAREALGLVGLAEYGGRGISQLSGGQRQRVAVARALAIRPKLLLFDEPLSNLDAGLRDTMRIEIRRLITRTGITALFVTHDQSEAFSVADRVAILNEGRLVQIGRSDEIYDRPVDVFSAAFLGGCNLIPGRITGASGSEWVISALDTELRASLGQSRQPLVEGQRVMMAIRPHQILIGAPGEGDSGGGVTVRVESMEDLGSMSRLIVEHASGQSLKVTAPGHVRVREGEALGLRWSARDVWLLPSGDGS